MRQLVSYLSYFFIECLCWSLYGVRLLLGPVFCRYSNGCTKFALEKLRSSPLYTALLLIVRRLYSCASKRPLDPDLL